MPLSEHEQRLLEQMERALHEEDPKLASTLRHGSNYTVNGRQVLLGSLGVVLGLAALLTGSASSSQKRNTKSAKSSAGFMSKVEERWRKRREGEGI